MTEGEFIEVSGVTISGSEYITWTPQEDITAYELAQCVGLIHIGYAISKSTIPNGCERHFTTWRQTK